MSDNDKKYYLNDASTKYNVTNEFNMSDALYEENVTGMKRVKQLESKIKRIINAPENAVVIFNSGASESIATCIHWTSIINPYGTIVGTNFDHSTVEENCKLYSINYTKMDVDDIGEKEINDRISAMFMTHVDGKTGEILDVGNVSKEISSYTIINDNHDDEDSFMCMNRKVLQTKPLLFLDATQSIMKTPIDMANWNINAVFWSNHKIGGNVGRGVLVINATNEYPFVPLIGGVQNYNMRGGSMTINEIMKDAKIYDKFDNANNRIKEWKAAYKYLTNNGVKVYKPKHNHLYSTLLLDTGNKCPYTLISELSHDGIYLSPKSACMVEQELSNPEKNKIHENDMNVKGGNKNDFDNAVRISFTEGNQLDGFVLKRIVDAIK